MLTKTARPICLLYSIINSITLRVWSYVRMDYDLFKNSSGSFSCTTKLKNSEEIGCPTQNKSSQVLVRCVSGFRKKLLCYLVTCHRIEIIKKISCFTHPNHTRFLELFAYGS